MKRTFEVLRKYMEKYHAVETVLGRDVKYSIPNVQSNGIDALLTAKSMTELPNEGAQAADGEEVANEEDGGEEGEDPEEEEELEVEDDGDLEV